MATLENVERLRERANVTYEEAKEALDANGDDLLDAMIWLEAKGKVSPPCGGGSYSSNDPPKEGAPQGGYRPQADPPPRGETFSQVMGRFFRFCGGVIDKGNRNMFDVWRHGELQFSLPVTVLVILLLFCFYVMLPLAVIGLFFGFRYRFSGKELEHTGVNKAMDSAAEAAETFKEEIRHPKEEKPEPDNSSDPSK